MENTRTLADILGAYRSFEVPPYQRPYAWTRQEVLDLVGDLRDIPSGLDHFTGTLVLHQLPAGNTVHVVDGQQRLTTIIVLLDRIARRLRELGNADAAAAIEQQARLRDPRPVLKLYGALDQDLRRRILADQPLVGLAGSAGGRRLVAARDQIDAALRDASPDGGTLDAGGLQALADRMFNHLQFAVVVVTDASDVGLIFETMNNRGRSLSELEKVKNYLLFVASRVRDLDDYLDDLVNETWSHLFSVMAAHDLVRRSTEEQFLRSHWLATMDPSVQGWQGYGSVRKRFAVTAGSDPKQVIEDIRQYLASLESLVTAYADAVAPDDRSFEDLGRNADQARRSSRKLNRLEAMATFLPLLLVARQRVPQRYIELVDLCENFAFRVYRIAGWQTRSAQGAFAARAHRLWEAPEPEASLEEIMVRVKADLVTRCPFTLLETHMANRELDWYRNLMKLRHLLFEYEEELCGRHPFPFDWDRDEQGYAARTVEHILPQYVDQGYEAFSEEQRKRLRDDLGNLCLTRDNSAMSNLPFVRKRELYRQGLEQERQLAALEEWTPDELERRRQRLVEFVLRRWRLPDEDALPEADVPPDELAPPEEPDDPALT